MMSFATLAAVTTILVIVYLYATRNFSHWRKRNVPYVKPVPFFGNLLHIFLFKCNLGQKFAEIYSKTKGPICGVFIMNRPALILRDPKLIKHLLVSNADTFNNRYVAECVDQTENSKGAYGMFVGKDDIWKNLRKTVTPIFSSLTVKTMSLAIEDCNDKFIDYLLNCTTSTTEVEVRQATNRYSIQTVCSAYFDIDAECFSQDKSPWRTLGSLFFDYRLLHRGIHVAVSFIAPKVAKYLQFEFYDKTTFKFVAKKVVDCVQERRAQSLTKRDYLEILEAATKKLRGKDDVLNSSVEIFAAGVETVSASLIFALYEMTKHQDIQKKLREEIAGVVGSKTRVPIDELDQMTYLGIFLKEVYRMHPLNPFLERVARKDLSTENLGLPIKKGLAVYIPVLGIHHDPQYYPEPEIFKPERFLGDVDWSVYYPFGIGPRMCIAKQYAEVVVKLAIANIVNNFELKFSPRSPEYITYNTKGFTTQVSGNMFLDFHPLRSTEDNI